MALGVLLLVSPPADFARDVEKERRIDQACCGEGKVRCGVVNLYGS